MQEQSERGTQGKWDSRKHMVLTTPGREPGDTNQGRAANHRRERNEDRKCETGGETPGEKQDNTL